MSNPSFDFDPRTRVLFGSGTSSRLGEMAIQYGGTHALLVTDPGIRDAGHEARAIQSLTDAGIRVSIFDDVRPNPTTLDIDRGTQFAKDLGVDLMIGLGGGSSMDCAKGINFLLTNGGKMVDYKGTGKATKPMLPFIAIPTTSGTGSEAQSYAVISDEETHMKMACGDKKALACVSILDPDLTLTMPQKVTAATGVDAISHALETFVTLKGNAVSHMFSQQAWILLTAALPQVLAQPDHLQARGAMQQGAYFAGAAIENSMLGATHALANPVSAHFDTIHGIAIGALLPYVVAYNSQKPGVEMRYRWLAQLAGIGEIDDEQLINKLCDRLVTMVDRAGQPTNLKECGVEEDLLPQMAAEAAAQWTAQFNPRPVDEASLLEIYQCAYHGIVAIS
ncbi:iron-containing alcohol dehydrogenase [Planctomicrobium sp. SH668]|uniref:iron-containing alcohol dehydrogenase n=1 Tax=Planctomicrobium sp. SH668 TaxID=3448126 RepID=UPI003F5B700D